MMTLIEFDDPGLLLLPYHRVIGGLSPEQLNQVRAGMDDVFEARPLNPDVTPAAAVSEVARVGENAHCFAAFWADAPPTIHTLRPGVDWAGWGQLAVSEAWVLQERALAPALGDALAHHVDYSPDHEAIVQQVNAGSAAGGYPAQALPPGTVPPHRQRRQPSAPQVNLLLPQAAHRPGNQPAGRPPVGHEVLP